MLASLSPEFGCMLLRMQLSFANGQCFGFPNKPAQVRTVFWRLLRPAMLAHQIMTNRSGFAPSGIVVLSHGFCALQNSVLFITFVNVHRDVVVFVGTVWCPDQDTTEWRKQPP
jgi:hypothetical protein